MWVTAGRTSNATIAGSEMRETRLLTSPLHTRILEEQLKTIFFTLVLNYFGVKCLSKQFTNNLVEVLKENCKISEDWDVSKYCGLSTHLLPTLCDIFRIFLRGSDEEQKESPASI